MKLKALFYLILLTFLASLITAMHAQTFSVIHAFTGAGGEGQYPSAGVTIRGNALYGTTSAVYQLTHAGSNWVMSALAVAPSVARPVFGPDGRLYGTTNWGGIYNWGTVFKLTPPVGICRSAACYWTVNDLHDFGSGGDGLNPGYNDLIWDQQGNIYGTATSGGKFDFGIVWKLTPSGNGYTESILHSFSGPDGAYPCGDIAFDSKGNLFGTTCGGGANHFGTVFELSYVPGVGWTEHVLHDFQDANDGRTPVGGVMFDSAGNLYGTSSDGNYVGGAVFELSPSGDTWIFKLLYSFPLGGRGPFAPLTMDGAGNLYGTTNSGGIYSSGSVFKLSNTGNGWAYTSLHDFTGGADGGIQVISNVSIDTDGALYGTAMGGGDMNHCNGYGCGVVWMIKP